MQKQTTTYDIPLLFRTDSKNTEENKNPSRGGIFEKRGGLLESNRSTLVEPFPRNPGNGVDTSAR